MKWNIIAGSWLSGLTIIWLVHPIAPKPWNTVGIVIFSVLAIANFVAAGIEFVTIK